MPLEAGRRKTEPGYGIKIDADSRWFLPYSLHHEFFFFEFVLQTVNVHHGISHFRSRVVELYPFHTRLDRYPTPYLPTYM